MPLNRPVAAPHETIDARGQPEPGPGGCERAARPHELPGGGTSSTDHPIGHYRGWHGALQLRAIPPAAWALRAAFLGLREASIRIPRCRSRLVGSDGAW